MNILPTPKSRQGGLHSFCKLLLFASLMLFFGLMIFLAFFNYAHTDDYILMVDVNRQDSFWGYEKGIYQHWGGRFLSMFIGKLHAYNNSLLTRYWIHTLYLLILNASVCFLLIKSVSRVVLNLNVSNANLLLVALVYMAAQITSLPEISTAYYWFSSAVSYQPATIMIHFAIALAIQYVHTQNKHLRILAGTLLCLLIVLINFTNELSVLISASLLTLFALAGAFRRSRLLIIVLLLLFVSSAIITITAPGNYIRKANIPNAGLIQTATISLGRMLLVFWAVFKNPLFIVALASAILMGNKTSRQDAGFLKQSYFSRNPVALFLIPPVIIVCILAPVLYVSNGSFPERANNEVAQFIVLMMLAFGYYFGCLLRPATNSFSVHRWWPAVFAVSIVCNDVFGHLVRSTVAAPIFRDIMHQRAAVLVEAAKNNTTAILPGYREHADSLIQSRSPGARSIIRELMLQRPPVFLSIDEISTPGYAWPISIFYGAEISQKALKQSE